MGNNRQQRRFQQQNQNGSQDVAAQRDQHIAAVKGQISQIQNNYANFYTNMAAQIYIELVKLNPEKPCGELADAAIRASNAYKEKVIVYRDKLIEEAPVDPQLKAMNDAIIAFERKNSQENVTK